MAHPHGWDGEQSDHSHSKLCMMMLRSSVLHHALPRSSQSIGRKLRLRARWLVLA